jgi:hypothetical protein
MDMVAGAMESGQTGNAHVCLPLAQYRLRFAGDEAAQLPRFPGSAWRGALGHALRRAVCVTRQPTCDGCLLQRSCVFPYLFDTPPPPDARKMRRYERAPHPFALQVTDDTPATADAHDAVLGVTLFGHANRHLPYVIHALTAAGADGVGKGRHPWVLQGVEQYDFTTSDWRSIYTPGGPLGPLAPTIPVIPDIPPELSVHLLTPLRVKRDGHLAGPDGFRFSDCFATLLRRISMLSYFHTDTPLETDFRSLVAAAAQVEIRHTALRWYDWTRYSSRQHTTMQMGGLLGSFQLSMQDLSLFWPYLWIGQWTHAGKGASMGLGQYRIEAASLPKLSPSDT